VYTEIDASFEKVLFVSASKSLPVILYSKLIRKGKLTLVVLLVKEERPHLDRVAHWVTADEVVHVEGLKAAFCGFEANYVGDRHVEEGHVEVVDSVLVNVHIERGAFVEIGSCDC